MACTEPDIFADTRGLAAGPVIAASVSDRNDFASTSQFATILLAFTARYNQTARPFNWKYTAADLARTLDRISAPPATRQATGGDYAQPFHGLGTEPPAVRPAEIP